MDLIKVYVAGPYTNGDVAVNVKNALSTANVLKNLNLGKRIIPFIPHLTHFWHLQYPDDGDYWLSWDMVWLKECDALFRIEGYSKGADQEEKFAIEQGIPRFYTLDAFKIWVAQSLGEKMTKDQLMASIVNIVPEASYLHNQENVSIDKLLSMAAEKCFIQKIETPEAVDIRWALKQLKTYGYIAY